MAPLDHDPDLDRAIDDPHQVSLDLTGAAYGLREQRLFDHANALEALSDDAIKGWAREHGGGGGSSGGGGGGTGGSGGTDGSDGGNWPASTPSILAVLLGVAMSEPPATASSAPASTAASSSHSLSGDDPDGSLGSISPNTSPTRPDPHPHRGPGLGASLGPLATHALDRLAKDHRHGGAPASGGGGGGGGSGSVGDDADLTRGGKAVEMYRGLAGGADAQGSLGDMSASVNPGAFFAPGALTTAAAAGGGARTGGYGGIGGGASGEWRSIYSVVSMNSGANRGNVDPRVPSSDGDVDVGDGDDGASGNLAITATGRVGTNDAAAGSPAAARALVLPASGHVRGDSRLIDSNRCHNYVLYPPTAFDLGANPVTDPAIHSEDGKGGYGRGSGYQIGFDGDVSMGLGLGRHLGRALEAPVGFGLGSAAAQVRGEAGERLWYELTDWFQRIRQRIPQRTTLYPRRHPVTRHTRSLTLHILRMRA